MKDIRDKEEIAFVLDNIVAFSILMESNDGILGKSPVYIKEKFEMCLIYGNPIDLLDNKNKDKYLEWKRRWG